MTLKMMIKRRARSTVMQVGRRLSPIHLQRVSTFHGYLELGSWTARMFGEAKVPDHPGRADLFDITLKHVTGQRPLYLEFGVYRGQSLRWFSENLTNPEARFVGFDSFEGLPENWNGVFRQGDFAVESIPTFDDDRVSLEVGWFDSTLSNFEVPWHDQLILNMDADLYSSTAFVLATLEPHLRPGTLIYFDEFFDRDHEQRALREFIDASGILLRPLARAAGGCYWLFEVQAG